MDAQPTEALRIGFGIAYIDALVKNIDARGTGVLGTYTPANASKWSGNAMVRYTWPLFGGHLHAQVDGNYLSKFFFAISDTPVLQQGGYGITNLRLVFNAAGDKLEFGGRTRLIQTVRGAGYVRMHPDRHHARRLSR